MTDWNEEAAENTVDNATNLGELNTNDTGLADDVEMETTMTGPLARLVMSLTLET